MQIAGYLRHAAAAWLNAANSEVFNAYGDEKGRKMGDFYKKDDHHIEGHLDGLNLHFAPGAPIKETARLHKKFNIFSEKHSLKDSISVLNVAGVHPALRNKWHKLLGWVGKLDSNQPHVTGGRAVSAMLKKNLESPKPLPVHFTSHNHRVNPKVMVKTKPVQRFFYSKEKYMTVSLPLRKSRDKKAAKR